MSIFSPRQEKAIKKRILGEFDSPSKFWKQQVLGKFTLCPYCGEIGATIGEIMDMVEEQFHHFVTKCSGWGNWQGEYITLNRLQNMAKEIEVKHKLVNDANWHFFDQVGNWYCPSCAQPVPTRYHKFKKLDLKSIKGIQEHCMVNCLNSKRGRMSKFLAPDFLKRTVAIANAAIKLVPEIRQLMKTDFDWTKKNTNGAWTCPFCIESIEKIDISTKFNMLEKAPEIAMHLVTRCTKFQTHYKKHRKCKIDYTLTTDFLESAQETSGQEEFSSSPAIKIAQDDLPDFLKPAGEKGGGNKTSPQQRNALNKSATEDRTITSSQERKLSQIQVQEQSEKLYQPEEELIKPAQKRLQTPQGMQASLQTPQTSLPAHAQVTPPSTEQETPTPPQQNNTDQAFFETKNEIKNGIMEVYAIPSTEGTEYPQGEQNPQMNPQQYAQSEMETAQQQGYEQDQNGFYDDTFESQGDEEFELSGSFSNLPLFNLQPGTAQNMEDFLPDWMSDNPSMDQIQTTPTINQFSSDLHKPFADQNTKIAALQKDQEEDIFRILDNELFLESTFKLKSFKDSPPKEVMVPKVSESQSSSPAPSSASPALAKGKSSAKAPAKKGPRKVVRRVKKVLKVDPKLMENLKQVIPKIPDDLPFEMKMLFKPSPRISGDFYNIYQLDETQFVFTISSTSLRGKSAIDLNLKFCQLLRENLNSKNLVISLCRMNELIYDYLGSSHYYSVFLGILDMSSWKIRFSNAGHNSLLIYNLRSKKVRTVSTNGIVMGANQGSFFKTVLSEEEVQLTPETIMIQYSSGVLEQRNKETKAPWGFQNFYNLILQNANNGIEPLLNSIETEIKNYTNGSPQKDDCTVLAIRL